MSGISSTSTSSASTVGTDLAPITFPGIASGIDYNSIITKLTSLTLAPNTQYNSQITQLNSKNAELVKINNMLSSIQGALTALSDPATFNAYSGTTTDPLDASVSQVTGGNPVPGSYSVWATHLATATQISGGASVGVSLSTNLNVALMCAGTAVTPSNGTSGQTGLITIEGVSVNYDVTSQSLASIVDNIYAAVHAVDSGFTIAASASGVVSLSSSDSQISLGSPADRGNLEQVLKLDVARVNNTSGASASGSVTGAGSVFGVNAGTALNAAGNAGFGAAVTTGSFTINGVVISVNAATDNVASVLTKINSSTAGIVASFDPNSDTFSLTNKTTGPQSIVVGATGDSSNFLALTGLASSAAPTTTVGDQAYVAILTASGALQTTYSNSDSVVGAIPGMAIAVTGSTTVPFTVTVAQNSALPVSTISSFVSLYNATMNEIALATAPPIVAQTATATAGSSASSVLASGGILYGDQTIEALSSRLTQLVTGLTDNGSTSYNSLQSIGLSLDSSHTVYQSNTNAQGGTVDATQSGAIATSSVDGTDGQFLPLDVTTFTAAFAADPSAVASMFVSTSRTSTQGLTNNLGAYLTGVTGFPTSLVSGLVGSIPAVSIMQSDENASSAQITALTQSIKSVTDNANAQANLLRAQATASEVLMSKYQSEQSAVNQLSGTSSSSSSS
jgi:flagellar hook-associated protein 2